MGAWNHDRHAAVGEPNVEVADVVGIDSDTGCTASCTPD